MTNWNAPAKLIERDDSGSERDFDFHERAVGPLAELVRRVAAMSVSERARVLIDAGPAGTLNVGEIMALAAREDFPA